MSQTIKREPCNLCHSRDNLTTWEYKGKIFQQCKNPSCSASDSICIDGGTERNLSQKDSIICDDKKLEFLKQSYEKSIDFLTGEYKETRGLDIETCKKIGILMQGNNHIFQYLNAQKIRFPKEDGKKGMYWIGDSTATGLFGGHLDYDITREIIITEGEFDAGSCYRAGYQACSIRNGAGKIKTAEEIKNNLEWLSRFSRLIFWFDSDAAGQSALKEVLEVEGLPLWKVSITNTSSPFKDANEALLAGQKDNVDYIKQIIDMETEDYQPEGIIRGDQIDFSILEEPEELGIPFQFEQLQECYHGLRSGEILLIGAGSGAGKSLFCKHLIINWLENTPNLRIASVFLEEKQKFTLQSLVALSLKKKPYSVVEHPHKGLKEEGEKLLGHKRIFFDNHFGSLESKKLFQKLRFLAYKTDVIILDHISIIVSGMDGNDERKDIDRLMTKLKSLAVETGVRFVIISHLRRANGDQTYEQGMPITSNSFRGSHSLYQLSDSVISLERNQQDTVNKNKVLIRALKNRYKGDVGILDELYYNKDTGCLQTLGELFK